MKLHVMPHSWSLQRMILPLSSHPQWEGTRESLLMAPPGTPTQWSHTAHPTVASPCREYVTPLGMTEDMSLKASARTSASCSRPCSFLQERIHARCRLKFAL